MGLNAEQILEQYPDLTSAQVHAALTYYYDHQAEMDAALVASFEQTERLRKQHQPRSLLVTWVRARIRLLLDESRE